MPHQATGRCLLIWSALHILLSLAAVCVVFTVLAKIIFAQVRHLFLALIVLVLLHALLPSKSTNVSCELFVMVNRGFQAQNSYWTLVLQEVWNEGGDSVNALSLEIKALHEEPVAPWNRHKKLPGENKQLQMKIEEFTLYSRLNYPTSKASQMRVFFWRCPKFLGDDGKTITRDDIDTADRVGTNKPSLKKNSSALWTMLQMKCSG